MLAAANRPAPTTWLEDRDLAVFNAVAQGAHHTTVWRRSLSAEVIAYAESLCVQDFAVTSAPASLAGHLPDAPHREAFVDDVRRLAARFAALVDRPFHVDLSTVTHDKCRRFHVDYYQLRLVTTYVGRGTEWIPEEHVRPHVLENLDLRVEEFNLAIAPPDQVRRLDPGDVLLMRGRAWPGPRLGLGGPVHRSPAIQHESGRRVLLTFTV